jgi:hypothetical protein
MVIEPVLDQAPFGCEKASQNQARARIRKTADFALTVNVLFEGATHVSAALA